jgi:hypothetical protein
MARIVEQEDREGAVQLALPVNGELLAFACLAVLLIDQNECFLLLCRPDKGGRVDIHRSFPFPSPTRLLFHTPEQRQSHP